VASTGAARIVLERMVSEVLASSDIDMGSVQSSADDDAEK
jgi:hypothetical protein